MFGAFSDRLNMFSVGKYEVEPREVTTWLDRVRRFVPGLAHLVIVRGDGAERHLWGADAKKFLKLLGAPQCFEAKPLQRAA